jgi:hypothetical protein
MPQATVAQSAQSVAQSAEEDEVDDEASDDVEPVPAPRKNIIKKKIVSAVKK